MNGRRLERISLRKVKLKKQPRQNMSKESLQGLRGSIREHGILQPPIFKLNEAGEFDCVAGHRRVNAAILEGMTEIEALVIREEMKPGDAIVLRATENLQREDLNPIEVAFEIQAVRDAKGFTGEQVAKALGKTPGYVTKHDGLLKLPEWIQELITSKKIGVEAGYQLSRCGSEEEQAKLANDVAENRLSRNALIRKLRANARNTEAAQTTKTKRVTAKLDAETSVSIAAPEMSLDRWIEILEKALSKSKAARKNNLSISTMVKALRDQAVA